MNEFFLLWLLAALTFLVIELGNPGYFFFLSFSAGAVMSALLSSVGYDVTYQMVIFLVSSVGAWYGLTVWIYYNRGHQEKSNVAALAGRKVRVVEDIRPYKPGAVTFDGSVWTAHAHHDVFLKGEVVMIQAVRGAHVVVVPVKHF